jgi:hypothetical protein
MRHPNEGPEQRPPRSPLLPTIDPRAEDALLARWPHLNRPGPQPCNQIAPDYATAVRRLMRPRPPERSPMMVALKAGRMVRRWIHEALAVEVAAIRRDMHRGAA